ncbi:MAG: hypothetical protein PHF86_04760 [Candidatus Nanoarchaeia archaeon]|jgi:hypothetical protein|nr:hypothetical protein [Candidatus Nanoarchaeia archaeon]
MGTTDIFSVLSELSKLGKKTKDVKIGELNLTLSTLDSDQEGNVFISCSDLTGNAYFYKLKSETLKHAIKVVNGKHLDDYEGIDDESKLKKAKQETLDKLGKIIGSWNETVISFLYSKWIELTSEVDKELKEKGLLEDTDTLKE